MTNAEHYKSLVSLLNQYIAIGDDESVDYITDRIDIVWESLSEEEKRYLDGSPETRMNTVYVGGSNVVAEA